MADRFKFDVIAKRLKSVSLNMMREIAMEHKNLYLDNFQQQGWDGKKWQEVNRRIKGTPEYEYPKKKGLKRRTRPILVGKGALRRAVNSSIKSITTNKISFVVDLPYAAIHNEGTRMKNGKKMPKRQYMGESRATNELTKKIIKKYADRSFNAGQQ